MNLTGFYGLVCFNVNVISFFSQLMYVRGDYFLV